MLASFSYRNRHSLVETFDPRARWIFSLLVLFTVVFFWDIRFLAFFFALTMLQYYFTRLTWQETKGAWILIFVLTTMMILVNTIITGAGGISGVITGGTPVIQWQWTFPITHWSVQYVLTVERLWFAVAQYLRVIAIGALFLIIPFTMDPRTYGITFKGIGFPDKLAFTMDLAFRFIPTLARDYQVTIDAQRARGYEIKTASGGVFDRIKRTAPLIVPVTMNSILVGEDIANAMELRCFGLMKRTWVEALKFRTRDYVLMGFSVALFVTGLILRYGFNMGGFWVP